MQNIQYTIYILVVVWTWKYWFHILFLSKVKWTLHWTEMIPCISTSTSTSQLSCLAYHHHYTGWTNTWYLIFLFSSFQQTISFRSIQFFFLSEDFPPRKSWCILWESLKWEIAFMREEKREKNKREKIHIQLESIHWIQCTKCSTYSMYSTLNISSH